MGTIYYILRLSGRFDIEIISRVDCCDINAWFNRCGPFSLTLYSSIYIPSMTFCLTSNAISQRRNLEKVWFYSCDCCIIIIHSRWAQIIRFFLLFCGRDFMFLWNYTSWWVLIENRWNFWINLVCRAAAAAAAEQAISAELVLTRIDFLESLSEMQMRLEVIFDFQIWSGNWLTKVPIILYIIILVQFVCSSWKEKKSILE